MMTAKELRASVLQAAVEGKLVPHRVEDGSASELLDRIRAERARLVKEKKAKPVKGGESVIYRDDDGHWYEQRGKHEPACIDEEIPFDIPENWTWTRLNAIGEIVGGGTPQTGTADYWASSTDGIPWITPADMKDIQGSTISNGGRYISELGLKKSSAQLLPEGSVIMSSRAPIGYLAMAGCALATSQGCKSVVPTEQRMGHWIMLAVSTQMHNIKQRATSTTFAEISGTKFGETFIPVPPLPEQQRIVVTINEVTPLIEDYGKAQERRADLDKALPSKLRASVLQAAVEGKLVPHRVEDGSASELLDRIRAERARLVKEKKAKPVKGGESVIYRDDDGHWYEQRGKHEPACIDEEILYEIPDTWKYMRLEQICSKIVDGDHNPPVAATAPTRYRMLSASNVKDGFIDFNEKIRYLTEQNFVKPFRRVSLELGDVLLTIVGTIGRTVVLDSSSSMDFCLQRSVAVLHPMLDPEYLKVYLDSPQVQHWMQEKAAGTAQKGFYLKQVANLVVPVPPFPEQQRIAATVQDLQREIDGLSL